MVSRPIQFSTDAAGPLYAFAASEANFTDWLADRIAVTLAAGRASVTLDDAHDWYVFDGSTAPTNWDQNIAFVDFSQFRQLNTLQQLLSGGSAVSNAPVTVDGVISGPIVIGDDYLAADGRSFDWFVDPGPGVIGDYSCRFGGSARGAPRWLVAGTITAVTVNSLPKWRLRFELPRSSTGRLRATQYSYSAELRRADAEITKILGTVQVVQRFTNGTI
jgi:hypothetical protein